MRSAGGQRNYAWPRIPGVYLQCNSEASLDLHHHHTRSLVAKPQFLRLPARLSTDGVTRTGSNDLFSRQHPHIGELVAAFKISVAVKHQAPGQYREACVEDMAHKAVKIEPVEFMKHFFPLPSEKMPTDDKPLIPRWGASVFEDLKGAEKMSKKEVQRRFTLKGRPEVAAIRTSNLAPGLSLAESQYRPAKGDISSQKVDSAFFPAGREPDDGRPHWAEQLVPVEFKIHTWSKDPFNDAPEGKLDADAESRKEARIQLIDYAERIFRYQHRTALFMLLVMGRRFRFLRWDRSGTIVTESMDYYENPQMLCEMLWRMSKLSKEELGCDPSATRLNADDSLYACMDDVASPVARDLDHSDRVLDEMPEEPYVFRYVRDMFRQSLAPEWPRYQLEIVQGQQTFHFLVGKPLFFATGMAGRGTRGYVAYDPLRKRFVWLKDAWRAHYELVDQEGTILRKLNADGVRNVPTVFCHGDILGQTTQTPTFWEMQNQRPKESVPGVQPLGPPPPPKVDSSSSFHTRVAEPRSLSSGSLSRKRSWHEMNEGNTPSLGGKKHPTWEDCPLRRHMHYRIVVEEVALPLKEFKSGRQLVSLIVDCVVAHMDATEKSKVIHRDVSGGNILVLPHITARENVLMVISRGLLADWELAKPVSDQQGGPRARRLERVVGLNICSATLCHKLTKTDQGTWKFMSVAVLCDMGKVVETSDELESFFYVLLYYSSRYLRSNCADAGAFIEHLFDDYSHYDGEYMCGVRKKQLMKGLDGITTGSGKAIKFQSKPLDKVFKLVLGWFKAHYVVQGRKTWEEARSQPSPPSSASPDALEADEDAGFYGRIAYGDVDGTIPQDKAVPRDQTLPEEEAPRVPTQQEKVDAENVASHNAMIKALDVAKIDVEWKADRVNGDNVPDNYKPKHKVGHADTASETTFKRRKLESSLTIWRGGSSMLLPHIPPPRKGATYF
ncbi:hypothetical protein C8Q77DRAFT_1074732 [Trametes polyzona]|nr:hypothetical protein C8Q77DRAFT_1074732 [Trametes polyzona]